MLEACVRRQCGESTIEQGPLCRRTRLQHGPNPEHVIFITDFEAMDDPRCKIGVNGITYVNYFQARLEEFADRIHAYQDALEIGP